jgi:hypothetical protein
MDDGIVVYFVLDSCGISEVQEFSEEPVDHCVATDDLDTGDQQAGGLGQYRQQCDLVQLAVEL